MTHLRVRMWSGLVVTLACLGSCQQLTPMLASTNAMTARLTGPDEVPPVSSQGSGTVEADLNRKTNVLNWTVTYSGLSGPVTAAHFHGPASPDQTASVMVPITGSLESPIKGQSPLTSTQIDSLIAGRWYVNLHTAAHPAGEVRGQLIGMR